MRPEGDGAEGLVIVHDPVTRRYLTITAIQARLLELLDGSRSPQELTAALSDPTEGWRGDERDLRRLVLELEAAGLVEGVLPPPVSACAEPKPEAWWRRLPKWGQRLVFLRTPALPARGLLDFLQLWCGWILNPVPLAFAAAFLVISAALWLTHAEEFFQQASRWETWTSWEHLWTLWVAVGVAKVLHELGHGLVCERVGARCGGVGAALLMFSPCLYCDVTSAWMTPRRRDRIAIALAGIGVELALAALCVWLWRYAPPGPLQRGAVQLILATTVSTVLFNANPLLKYDGYYILSDWSRTPNLQQRGRQALQRSLIRLSGGTPSEDWPQGGWGEFACFLYGAAALIYRWMLTLGITLMLHRWLSGWGLSGVAWAYLGVNVLTAVASGAEMAQVVWRERARSGAPDARSGWLSGGLVVSMVALLLTPWPRWTEAVGEIEPMGLLPVYVAEAGSLEEVMFEPGEFVSKGDPLARLSSRELFNERADAAEWLLRQQTELKRAQAQRDAGEVHLTRQAVETAAARFAAIDRRCAGLVLRAPGAGRIVTADWSTLPDEAGRPAPGSDSPPHEPEMIGGRLDRRTPFFSLATNDGWCVQAYLPDGDVADLEVGSVAEVTLWAYPDRRWSGQITALTAVPLTDLPPHLREQLAIHTDGRTGGQAYCTRATVSAPIDDLPLRTGLHASVRFARPAVSLITRFQLAWRDALAEAAP